METTQRILPKEVPATVNQQQDMGSFREDRRHKTLPHVLDVLTTWQASSKHSAVLSQLMTESR